MSESFGKKLRELRKKRGLTLEELAQQADSTKAYIWQLENKSPAKPSGELLIKLSHALQASPDFLIDDEQMQPNNRQLADVLFRKMEDGNLSIEDMEAFIGVINKIKASTN